MSTIQRIFRLMLGRRLPIVEGTIEVPGCSEPIIIRRDQFGIPYIEAKTEADAWYALGYCQGQDRSFQLELTRRVVRGTTAELIGTPGLPLDRLSRRIGFWQAAQEQFDSLDPQTRETLAAFARGISEGRDTGSKRIPHEFVLLRTQPEPFEGCDVLAALLYLTFGLSTWSAKLSRLLILCEDGPEAVLALSNDYAEWLPVSKPVGRSAGKVVANLSADLERLSRYLGLGGGSNNWGVASSRTSTGRPLLANDPHLSPALPAPWYLAHIRTPEWTLAGAWFVGAPLVAAGFNGTAAWGVTAGVADNLDLYLEELSPDGTSIRDGEHFVPCEVRREIIRVKGEEPVTEEIIHTPRGPIISPAMEGVTQAISMQAIWTATEPLEIRGPISFQHVHTFEEFRQQLAKWSLASLNMIYADSGDSIGWQLAGPVPQRNNTNGLMPLQGWEPDVGWKDKTIPFDEMPFMSNPEAGFVATANTQPTRGDENGHYLGRDWADGYRLARIVEVLQSRDDWDASAMKSLQLDQQSIPWKEMKEIILATPIDSEDTQLALDLLKDWDGIVSADSIPATIFEFMLSEMANRMALSKAPRSHDWAMGKGFNPLVPVSHFGFRRVSQLVGLLQNQPEGWFGRGWPEEVADALATVIRNLRSAYGEPSERWAWGKVRPLTLKHPVGEQKPLDRIFNRGPFAVGGDSESVSHIARDLGDPTINPLFIANLRMVVDVGDWDNNHFVLAGGQSGNPLSPHYDDLLSLWRKGGSVSIAWTPTAIQKVTHSTLHLVKAAPSAR